MIRFFCRLGGAALIGLAACGSNSAAATAFLGAGRTGSGPAKVSGLGPVLVDGQGFTLYLYEPDAQSGHSQCSGPARSSGRPLTLPSGVTVAGGRSGCGRLRALHHPTVPTAPSR